MLAWMDGGVEAFTQQDIDVVRDIADFYSNDCMAFVINGKRNELMRYFTKQSHKKVFFIDISRKDEYKFSTSIKHSQECLILSDQDDQIEKILSNSSSLILHRNWFVKTKDEESILSRIKKFLMFDSNFNLLVKTVS